MTLPSDRNPYVGPRTFTREESNRFFGREREARELLALVTAERLTLFYAPSGAGKSSLINTRLIPGLEQAGFEVLPIGRIGGRGEVPESNPFIINLMHSLIPNSIDSESLKQLSLHEFLTRIVYVEDKYVFLTRNGVHPSVDESVDVEQSQSHQATVQIPRILIIDQFEEILTAYPGAWDQRTAFFQQLADAMVRDPYLWIVLSLREDYIAGLDPYAHIMPNRLRTRYSMQRMRASAALNAVKLPAAEIGRRPFAPGVAEELVDNLRQVHHSNPSDGRQTSLEGEFVEPVQLQVVCYQLWELLQERTDGTDTSSPITADDIKTLVGNRGLAGFVNEALGDYYEDALKSVLESPEIDVSERELRDWFSERLITPDGTRGLVRQSGETTAGLSTAAVLILAKRFLLRAENRGGDVWYELVHDRFVQPITEANRHWLQIQSNPVIVATQHWLDNERDPDLLLRGKFLEDARAYAQANSRSLGKLENAFLEASEQQQVRDAVARQRRMLLFFGIAAALSVLAAISGFWFGLRATSNANQARVAEQTAVANANRAATSETLARVAQQEALDNANRAATSEALARAAEQDAQAKANLLSTSEALARTAQQEALDNANRAATSEALARAAEQDAQINAIVSAAQAAQTRGDMDEALTLALTAADRRQQDPPTEAQQIIDQAIDATARHTYTVHEDDIYSVAVSADGTTAISGSQDKTIIQWDVASGQLVQTFQGHTEGVRGVAVSQAGNLIVSAGWDNTVRLWNINTGQQTEIFRGKSSPINTVAITRNGALAISGSRDGTIQLWNITTLQAGKALAGHDGEIWSIALSPDEKTFVSGGQDKTLKLWDIASGQLLKTFRGHTASVRGVAYSPDGKTLLSASGDHTVRLWDIASGQALRTFSGHTDAVWSVAYSPDGKTLLSASGDHTVRLWDIANGEGLHTFLGHTDAVLSSVFSSDGSMALSGSQDGTVRVWDIAHHNVEGSPIDKIQWVRANRYVAPADCEVRVRFNITPLCTTPPATATSSP